MSLGVKAKASAFFRTFYAVWLTFGLLIVQAYVGHSWRVGISLSIMAFFVIIRISAGHYSSQPNMQSKADFLSRATFLVWIIWMIINVPIVFPFLQYVFEAPLAVRVAFFLFAGTMIACLFLYFEFSDKWKRGEAQRTISRSAELAEKTHAILKQVQSRRVSPSRCEEMIERADRLMVISKGCLKDGGDPEDATLCAQSALDLYKKAVECLKN